MTRIGLNEDGTLDEIVANGAHVHLEQMSAGHYWMVVVVDGKRHTIHLMSRGKITARYEAEPD